MKKLTTCLKNAIINKFNLRYGLTPPVIHKNAPNASILIEYE